MEHFGGFFDCQPSEETQFHDAAFSRINLLERAQCIIDGDKVRRSLAGNQIYILKGDLFPISSAFLVVLGASVVNEDAPHRLCSDGEEMRAILPLHIPAINQMQVCFVDQRRGLQRVASAFAVHITLGQMMQLAIDQGINLSSAVSSPWRQARSNCVISCVEDVAICLLPKC